MSRFFARINAEKLEDEIKRREAGEPVFTFHEPRAIQEFEARGQRCKRCATCGHKMPVPRTNDALFCSVSCCLRGFRQHGLGHDEALKYYIVK